MEQSTHQQPAEFRSGRPRVTITLTEKRYLRPYRDAVRSKSVTVKNLPLEDVLAKICEAFELQVRE